MIKKINYIIDIINNFIFVDNFRSEQLMIRKDQNVK